MPKESNSDKQRTNWINRKARKIERVLQEQQRSRVISGITFNNPFYAIPSPPPWAVMDPCWACWKMAELWGKQIIKCRPSRPGEKLTPQAQKECDEIRRHFFKHARAYANCMDHFYGLNRADAKKSRTDFQPSD